MSFKKKRPLSGVRKIENLSLPLFETSMSHSMHTLNPQVYKSNRPPRLVRQVADLRFQQWHKFTQSLPQLIEVKDKSTHASTRQTAVSAFDKESAHVESCVEPAKTVPLNCLGLPFLRRPTLQASKPAPENGDLFKVVMKGKEMKPFSFQGDQIKAIEFYKSHYPLLMRKLKNSKGSLPGSAQILTGSDVADALKVDIADLRNRRVHEWLRQLEESLRRFETDPEDEGAIETILRSELFDPTSWPWNEKKYKLPEAQKAIYL